MLGDEDINMESLMERILVLKGQDSAVSCLATAVWAVLMSLQVYRKIYDSVFKNYTLYVQVRMSRD